MVAFAQQAREDWQTVLQSLAGLFVHGIVVDWLSFEGERARNRRRQLLPTYPFQREQYWLPNTGREMTVSSRYIFFIPCYTSVSFRHF